MGPAGEEILNKGYAKYLEMPLAHVGKETEIYKKRWCVITGLSFASPHPHRHYTFDEFLDRMAHTDSELGIDSEFCKRFFDDIKNT